MSRSRGIEPTLIRPGLLPAILAAIALVVGIFLVGADAYLVVQFAVSILALIIAVYAVQGRKWRWLAPLMVVAVLWNPVLPLPFGGTLWLVAHVLAAAAVLAVGLFLRVSRPTASTPGG
ncbi:MAG: hypothetical protein JWQ59_1942 [Cryobacterium sp.]|nr:hypothetical protein [Cryobacterium sp.]